MGQPPLRQVGGASAAMARHVLLLVVVFATVTTHISGLDSFEEAEPAASEPSAGPAGSEAGSAYAQPQDVDTGGIPDVSGLISAEMNRKQQDLLLASHTAENAPAPAPVPVSPPHKPTASQNSPHANLAARKPRHTQTYRRRPRLPRPGRCPPT